ncbi:MAG: VanW family protein, partial [Clostridia bacterium]|nr:VanW family protein [Clostridia bacterium]
FEVEPVGYTFEIEPDTVVIHAPVAGVKVDRNAVASRLEELFRSLVVCDIILEPVTTPPAPLNFEEFYAWLTSPAENAYYHRDENGKVSIQREKLQCSVEKDVVKAAVQSIEQSGNNTAFFTVTTTEPEVLSRNLKENLYKDKLGSYTTYYSGTAARNNNVRLATSRVNGYELMPGEVFSYDQTILPRTAANGYQAAPVYVGNKVESGMGGGICQPSSTLYCAALYANLEIVERHNHSMLVSYLPAGLDATISQGALDLKLKNNTPYPIKIAGQASGGALTFSIWGYNPENISVEILRGGGGYHYTATRVVKKDGAEISREQLGSSRYVPPAPSETPEPTESAAPEETVPPEESTAPEESTTPESGTSPNPEPDESQPPATAEPLPSATPQPVPTAEAVPTETPVSSDTIINE